MRRLLWCALAILCLSISVFAQKVKVLGVAFQSQPVVTSGLSSTTKAARTFPGCTIDIYLTGTTLHASIFSDANGTVKSNPFVTDQFANYDFYIDPNVVYDVRVSGTGVTTPFTRAGFTAPTNTGTPSIVTPDDYGAIHDGASHPLSSRYSTLSAAQTAYGGAYSFVTSLSQEIDYAAVKAASNAAFGPDLMAGSYITPDGSSTLSVIVDLAGTYTVNALAGQILFLRYPNGFIAQEPILSNTATTITLSIPLPFDYHTCLGQVCTAACSQPAQTFPCSQYSIGNAGEHGDTNSRLNRPLYLPGGTYEFGSDTWLIRNLSGAHIYGNARRSTKLQANGWVFQTDGLWYTKIENIEFDSLTSTVGHGAVDIDGNVPGHPYATRSVQQNTFSEDLFNGGESTYAFALNRLGGSASQGENLYVNCNWQSATVAYYQNGFNALADLILRGDMQDFTTGVYLVAGQIQVIGTSFESTRGYTQISDTSFVAQGGFDIDCSASGVFDRILVSGVRSESLRFYREGSSQPAVLTGNTNACGGCTQWSALGNFTLNQVITKNSVSAGLRLYRVTTAGTSGGAEPTWPNTGTVSDGSIVWTAVNFYVIDAVDQSGSVSLRGNDLHFTGGSIKPLRDMDYNVTTVTAATYVVPAAYSTIPSTIFVDATSNNVAITLPSFYGLGTDHVASGTRLTIKRLDNAANTVTISDNDHSPDGAPVLIPAYGWLQLEFGTGLLLGVPGQQAWRIISSSTTSGGSGTPGGSDTQVQFNCTGSFCGDAGLTYNSSTKTLSVGVAGTSGKWCPSGSTSGTACITVPAVAGTPPDLKLPTTSGVANNILSTDGSGTLSWLAMPYDISVFFGGVPASSAIFRVVAARAFDSTASWAGTVCNAGTAATAQTDFIIKKGVTTVGTLRFAASATTCTIVSPTTTSFAAGDVLSVTAPASPDASLANISISLTATLH